MAKIHLLPAAPHDAEMIFRWRNDPFILSRSSYKRKVGWNEHIKWFEETLNGNSRLMLIIHESGLPIGQIRFDYHSEHICIISIYILKDFVGKGYGVSAIRLGCSKIFNIGQMKYIVSCIRNDNLSAISAFEKSGFRYYAGDCYCPNAHFTLILTKAEFDNNKGDSK